MVFLCSDGISDNFDPVISKKPFDRDSDCMSLSSSAESDLGTMSELCPSCQKQKSTSNGSRYIPNPTTIQQKNIHKQVLSTNMREFFPVPHPYNTSDKSNIKTPPSLMCQECTKSNEDNKTQDNEALNTKLLENTPSAESDTGAVANQGAQSVWFVDKKDFISPVVVDNMTPLMRRNGALKKMTEVRNLCRLWINRMC